MQQQSDFLTPVNNSSSPYRDTRQLLESNTLNFVRMEAIRRQEQRDHQHRRALEKSIQEEKDRQKP